MAIKIDGKRRNVQHEGEEQAALFDWAFLQRKTSQFAKMTSLLK